MDNRRQAVLETDQQQYEEQVITIDRVSRVVKGGRRFRFRALVVVGDKKGTVGIGVAKGADVQSAVQKAVAKAKQKLVVVPITDTGTVPHEVTAKLSGALVLLKPASEGTGLIAGGVVRTVVELCGIKNILSKSLGSSNKISVAYATVAGLESMKGKEDWVTTRGKK